MPKHPVSESTLTGYALAVHDVLNDHDTELEDALFEHGVSTFQAKLIDGFIIQHSGWIWRQMQKEFEFYATLRG